MKTAAATVTALLASAVLAFAAQPLEPLIVGWEQYFRLTWTVAEGADHPVIAGQIRNEHGTPVTRIQLLVEGLGPSGEIQSQQVHWLSGDLQPLSSAPFVVPAPAASSHRVRVFAWERLETGPER